MIYLSELEEWRDIPGFEGEYEASSLGRIRTKEGKTTSSARFEKRVWKQRYLKFKWQERKGGKRDARVNLWHNGKNSTMLVARCICMAFNPLSDYSNVTVNHINGDPTDNRICNLEWLSISDNIRHAFKNGLMPTREVTLKNSSGELMHFQSLAEASRSLGRNVGYVSNHLQKGLNVLSDVSGERYTII